MKENRNFLDTKNKNKTFKNTKTVEINRKTPRKNQNELLKKITVFMQAVLAIILLIVAIMYIFIPEFLIVLQGIIVVFLVVGAYNSYKFYEKKMMSYLYILASIMVFSSLILGIINGK